MRWSGGNIADTRKKNASIQERALASVWRRMRVYEICQSWQSYRTVLGMRVSNTSNWRYRFAEDQSSFSPRDVVAMMRCAELGFRAINPVNVIFNLVKVSAVMLEKVRGCRERVVSRWTPSRFATQVIPGALPASTPTERASCRPADQNSLRQTHWDLLQNLPRTPRR